MKTAPPIGSVVAVTFLDHTEGEDILSFTAYGRVTECTASKLTIEAWEFNQAVKLAEDEKEDDNIHRFSLVRVAIQHIEILKEADHA